MEAGLEAQGADGSKKGTPKQLRVNSASAKSTVYQGRIVVETYRISLGIERLLCIELSGCSIYRGEIRG